jgi:hypothetical protein
MRYRRAARKQKSNSAVKQLDIINIYRPLQLTKEEHTFLSIIHRTFSKTDHTLGHKTNFNKLKMVESIQSVLRYQWSEIRNQR